MGECDRQRVQGPQFLYFQKNWNPLLHVNKCVEQPLNPPRCCPFFFEEESNPNLESIPGSGIQDRTDGKQLIPRFDHTVQHILKESSTDTSTVAKATMHRGKFFIRTFSGHCLLRSRLIRPTLTLCRKDHI